MATKTGTTAAKLLARMQDLDLSEPERDFLGCIYGPIGSGKTWLALQLAQALTQTGRILYLDSSDGWVSVSGGGKDKKAKELLRAGVTRLRVTSYADFAGIADALFKNAKGYEDFDVIIVDEATSIADRVIDEVAVDIHNDITLIEGRDYRPVQLLYMQALNKLHDTPGLSIILVGHDRIDKQGKGEDAPTLASPGFSPKLGKEIAKIMHVVAYLDRTVKGSENGPQYVWEVQCQPTRRISAKSRISDMPLRSSPKQFISTIVAWVDSGAMAEDLNGPEPQVAPEEDVDDEEALDDDDTPALDEQELAVT